jgi:hypothetical protein
MLRPPAPPAGFLLKISFAELAPSSPRSFKTCVLRNVICVSQREPEVRKELLLPIDLPQKNRLERNRITVHPWRSLRLCERLFMLHLP